MTRQTPTIKYLETHAEPEADLCPTLSRSFRHVACIPASNEGKNLLTTLDSLARADSAENSVVIVIINAREDAPESVHSTNHDCATELQKRAKIPTTLGVAEGCYQGMGVILIDRFSPGRRLPKKQGVGLARKIAADLALALMEQGWITERWIRCTDADAKVPDDYWNRPDQSTAGESAMIYPFRHTPEGDEHQRQAIQLYDAYLRYYADGLKQAGSPYAFPTIGSLLCIDGDAYAKVRGFPKRLAGEDFYILNKLAKVGSVECLQGKPIILEGRTSDRVPFGTGVAVVQIRERLSNDLAYEVYDPRVFVALKHWLNALNTTILQRDIKALHDALNQMAEPLGTILMRALIRTDSIGPVERAIKEVEGPVLRKRIHDWNDAFRTLKLVHALRDEGLANVPASTVLTPFMAI